MPGALIVGDTWMGTSQSAMEVSTEGSWSWGWSHIKMAYIEGQFSSSVFDFTFGAAKAEANARLRPSLNIV